MPGQVMPLSQLMVYWPGVRQNASAGSPAKSASFSNFFPFVCPEAVLVAMLIVFSIKWRIKGVFRTNASALAAAEVDLEALAASELVVERQAHLDSTNGINGICRHVR
eukprot:COSAG06_NODE_28724_length_569_cov_0.989362_1_plen_107_part_01